MIVDLLVIAAVLLLLLVPPALAARARALATIRQMREASRDEGRRRADAVEHPTAPRRPPRPTPRAAPEPPPRSSLRRAIVMAEILGPPIALRSDASRS